MPRPFPQPPRGRRKPIPVPAELIVPALSPQRVLHAMRVVVKPHDWTRQAIAHRLETDRDPGAEQVWMPGSDEVLDDVVSQACQRLGIRLLPADQPLEGAENWGPGAPGIEPPPPLWRLRFSPETPVEHRRAVAEVCSRHLPRTWFWLDPLALRGGRFWRREKGFRHHLRVAGDVHLPRDVRAVLKDLLPQV